VLFRVFVFFSFKELDESEKKQYLADLDKSGIVEFLAHELSSNNLPVDFLLNKRAKGLLPDIESNKIHIRNLREAATAKELREVCNIKSANICFVFIDVLKLLPCFFFVTPENKDRVFLFRVAFFKQEKRGQFLLFLNFV
jgi:hypothetical protein